MQVHLVGEGCFLGGGGGGSGEVKGPQLAWGPDGSPLVHAEAGPWLS